MMDFMDNLRRGVDRAGFEVDKLLRANRLRAQVGAIRSQMDEELRQIGRRVVESYDQNVPVPDVVKESCARVKRYETEIATREIELERINSETPPDVDMDVTAATSALKCPACGVTFLEGAKFCSNCGADLSAGRKAEPSPDEGAQSAPDAGPSQGGPDAQTT